MPLPLILGFFFPVCAAIGFSLNALGWTAGPVFALLMGCVFAVTAMLLDKPASAAWINDALCCARPPTLYHLSMDWLMPKLRRGLEIEQPAADAGVGRMLAGAFTYRLLDRAMLLAVIYPLLLLLMHWALSGTPAKLGGVEIIPAIDTLWEGVCGSWRACHNNARPDDSKIMGRQPEQILRLAF
jgi:hypothetical protein